MIFSWIRALSLDAMPASAAVLPAFFQGSANLTHP
jgi:hypothetical protein